MQHCRASTSLVHTLTHWHATQLEYHDTLTRCFHSHVVVRVDTHIILLEAVVVFAVLNAPKLVMCLQVRPAPQTAVNDMREALPMRHLQASV